VDRVLSDYFAAWNEHDSRERADLLSASLDADVELLDPLGSWRGIDGLSERIARYHESAPGTKVVPASSVDAHNGVERYAWRIVDDAGNELMEGLDVAERQDGRLKRIVMFHGPLPPES
jgi:SnoaL-like domain